MTARIEERGACPLCRSRSGVPFITGFDRLYPRAQNHDYLRCTSCGLIRISPMPDTESIASLYGGDYDPHGDVSKDDLERRLTRPFNRFLIRHWFGKRQAPSKVVRHLTAPLRRLGMRDTLTPQGECRLLDVGCGSGGWLYKHQLLGWNAQGVELVPGARERATALGLDVYLGDIFAVPLGQRFDVISFRSVLEHLPNPIETMERARQLLAPGGKVLVIVPNADSWGFSRYGVHWYPLDPPRHLLQFTPTTLGLLGEKAAMKLAFIRTEASPRWILYSRINARVFPPDILGKRDPGIRSVFIDQAKELRRRPSAEHRIYRRAVSLRAWWEARRGRGEMIRAVFTKEG